MARKQGIWCPTRLVLETIEGKWTIHIIRELLTGTKRHTEIARSLAGINPRTLTDRLRELEAAGMVRRRMYEEIPPRVEYSLTARGRELEHILDVLKTLGTSWKQTMNLKVSTMDSCPQCIGNGGSDTKSGASTKAKSSRAAKK